jgi:hypothetical protein
MRTECALNMGLWPGLASALDISDFNLVTTEDLYRICSFAPNDPTYSQGLAFCEGFLVGALSYHDAISDRTGWNPSRSRRAGCTVAAGRMPRLRAITRAPRTTASLIRTELVVARATASTLTVVARQASHAAKTCLCPAVTKSVPSRHRRRS